MLTRRRLMASLPAAVTLAVSATPAASVLGGQTVASGLLPPAGPFSLPPLPYAADALEPHVDGQTMTIHHDRHHAAYVAGLNAALADRPELRTRTLDDLVRSLDTLPDGVRTAVRNHGGGHLNHTWFWTSLRRGGSPPPAGDFGRAVDAAFGSFAKLQEGLGASAIGVFGSGWAWLSLDRGGRLVLQTTANQDNPLTHGRHPLLGIDVWEHAYYLRYQNRRRDYVDALFKVVDWEAVEQRWHAGKA